MNPNSRVRTIIECSCGGRHELCVAVEHRGVPPELRCLPADPQGYGLGGGGGCKIPADLPTLVERELRDNLQESKRRGYVRLVA